MYEESELDYSKLKYVLYVRKSTDDSERQVRTVEDQIKECLNLADRLGLRVVNRDRPLIEKKSAKIPGRRKIFDDMLKDLRAHKYDCILAWNPDRLSRNMLEGGVLINLVDEGTLKDLKFVTHYFTKDANGKMLLGMAFVLSKQYGDKLSQDITRGVRGNFAEGKTATPKHGYINENLIYRPDGKNFELICEAWQRRLKGESIKPIANYLIEQNYYRTIKSTGGKVRMTFQILSDLFKDTFYFGKLLQAHKTIDLREMYDFKPVITEEEYNKVQQMGYRSFNPSKKRFTFYPLRKFVTCKYCHSNCRVGASTSGGGGKLLYFRCDNPSCPRKKKSIRAHIIFNFVYDFLAAGLNFGEKEYQKYLARLTEINDKKMQQVKVEISSRQGALKSFEKEIRDRALRLGTIDNNSTVWEIGNKRIEELQNKKMSLESQIVELKEKIKDPKKDTMTLEQFLNFSKNAGRLVKFANMVVQDRICRIIFLNFEIDEKKVTSYRLKEPFTTLYKTSKFLSGGDGGN